jgi:hypothetical protein
MLSKQRWVSDELKEETGRKGFQLAATHANLAVIRGTTRESAQGNIGRLAIDRDAPECTAPTPPTRRGTHAEGRYGESRHGRKC